MRVLQYHERRVEWPYHYTSSAANAPDLGPFVPVAATDTGKKRRPRKPKGNQPTFALAEELERILEIHPKTGVSVLSKCARLDGLLCASHSLPCA